MNSRKNRLKTTYSSQLQVSWRIRHFFVICRHVVRVVADSCEQEVHGEQEFRDTTQLIEI